MRAVLVALGVVAIGAVVFFLLQTTSVTRGGQVQVGQVAEAQACTEAHPEANPETCLPELDLVTLAGKPITADMLRGKVVMINFWATWCSPCVKEMPDLEAVYQRYREQGFVVVGILADSRASDVQAEAFAIQHGVNYPIVRSTPELEDLFDHPDRLPTSFLYDQRGYLRAKWKRGVTDPQLDTEVGGLVAH